KEVYEKNDASGRGAVKRKSKEDGATCSNCAVSLNGQVARKGRCNACYGYHQNNGIERPLCCTNCGAKDTKLTKGRCNSCWAYFRTHNTEKALPKLKDRLREPLQQRNNV
ncbi:hypothetical protein F4819DRAFT_452940, partial [Hypoxylon fuscum]